MFAAEYQRPQAPKGLHLHLYPGSFQIIPRGHKLKNEPDHLFRRNDLVRMQGNLGGGASGVRATPVEPAGFRDAVHLRGFLHRQVHGLLKGQRGPAVRGPTRAG